MIRDLEGVRQRLADHSPRMLVEPGVAEAAVAVILAPVAGSGLQTLLIKRADRQGDTWSGQMAFPGGRKAARDTDSVHTALRETLEETGIELDRSAMLGALDDLHPRSPVLPPIIVRPIVFGLPLTPVTRVSAEVAGCVWVSLATLWGRLVTGNVAVRGSSLTVQGYRVGSDFVWGMTERIITPFLKLIS